MTQPSKDNQSKRSKGSQLPDQDTVLLGELAEFFLDSLKGDSQKNREPFERYAHELKLRLHQDVKLFRDRFVQGYEALLDVLKR